MNIRGTVLVGNGPSVLGRNRGEFIDSCSRVCRFNSYKLDGFREHTGSKTDVWIVNEGYVHGELKPPAPRPPKTLLAVAWWKPAEGCLWQRMAGQCIPGLDLVDERAARWLWENQPDKEHWPSTGLLALRHFIAETNCERPVFIAGFDCFLADRHHYGDDGAFCGHHDGEWERSLIEVWINMGLVARL